MRKPYLDETWLAPMLARNLGQVSAPDELLHRIHHPRAGRARKPIALRTVDLMVVSALLALVVWGIFPRKVLSPQALAIQALNRGPEELELQSGTVSEIRSWVKTRTGLDLPLSSETSRRVRLKGVCAVKGATPTIEVAYRVGSHNAALLVSKASPEMAGDGKHRFLKCEATGGARVSSWIMRGQLYTLAYAAPGDLRDECLLCHSAARMTD